MQSSSLNAGLWVRLIDLFQWTEYASCDGMSSPRWSYKKCFHLGSLSLLLSLGKDGCHIVKQPWGEVHVVKNGGLQETPSMYLEADLLSPANHQVSELASSPFPVQALRHLHPQPTPWLPHPKRCWAHLVKQHLDTLPTGGDKCLLFSFAKFWVICYEATDN